MSQTSTTEIVEEVADQYLPKGDIQMFIQESFITVLTKKGYGPEDTQARASITGDVYEICLAEILTRYYPWIEFERNVLLPDACMGNGQGADFVFYENSTYDKDNILSVIEAKGSADTLRWNDGTVQKPSRPGLKRTDTMKKAVCQAYQVKSGLGTDVQFHILTSHKPTSGNSYCIYEQAVGDIVTSVIDTTDKQEFDTFARTIQNQMK